MINIETIVTGALDVNSYVVWGDGNECFIVDAGGAEPILRFISERNLVCKHILITHGHFDHITGIAKLKEATGARIFIHEKDAAALYDANVSLAASSGAFVAPSAADALLHDNDVINAAGFEIRVIPTPGHTPGGVCYLIESERVIFSGDTLFRLSVGRCDFPNCDAEALFDGIIYRLFTLKGDYDIYPGHMRKTTLDLEREKNPFVKRRSAILW